jgi:hypothetical protein
MELGDCAQQLPSNCLLTVNLVFVAWFLEEKMFFNLPAEH